MTEAEGLVLVAATILAAMVVLEGRNGNLSPRVGVLLLTAAALAVLAAVVHLLARV